MLQHVCYKGHEKDHGIKFQGIITPDGLIVHLAGPMAGMSHDWILYLESSVHEMLSECLLVNGIQYFIYGDAAYHESTVLYKPIKGGGLSSAQKAFNTALARARTPVEWAFRQIKSMWAIVGYNQKRNIRQRPIMYIVHAEALLHNAHNSLHPNQVSKYFQVHPPGLAQYIEERGAANAS